jgi:hypothetical protein
MNSFNQVCFQLRAIRIISVVPLCLAMLFLLKPEISSAQGAVIFRHLAKFAGSVLAGAASSIIADEAKGMIHSEKKKPDYGASGIIANSDPKVTNYRSSGAIAKRNPKIRGYMFTLTWHLTNGDYTGTLVMRGVMGTFRVTTLGTVIDQNMIARPYGRDILLVGSNPRYAGINVPNSNYSPDTFRLTHLSNGAWIIADTCDTQGICSPVHVIAASTF